MLFDLYLLAIPVISPFQNEALELYCIHPYPPDYFHSQIAVPSWYTEMTSHLILIVWKHTKIVFFMLLEYFFLHNLELYLKCVLTWHFNVYSYYPCLSSPYIPDESKTWQRISQFFYFCILQKTPILMVYIYVIWNEISNICFLIL